MKLSDFSMVGFDPINDATYVEGELLFFLLAKRRRPLSQEEYR